MDQARLPWDAYFAEHAKVPTDGAVGRIAAEMITPYLPGIPVVLSGAQFTERTEARPMTGRRARRLRRTRWRQVVRADASA